MTTAVESDAVDAAQMSRAPCPESVVFISVCVCVCVCVYVC